MQRSMNVLALVKDSERFVFLYDDQSIGTLLQTLGKYAADKSLSFTWYDAAVLSQKVRKLRQESDAEPAQEFLPPAGGNRLRDAA
jgi:integrase/recombinase XerC